MNPKLIIILVAWITALAGTPAVAQDRESLWQAVKEGTAFAMMRHALAPGTGDPANFTPDDCETQRNLSEAGRQQARDIGARFRKHGIEQVDLYTSQWCRCRDTAELLMLGAVMVLPALNSFYENFERRESQTTALKTWLAQVTPARPLVLVTHQVNITALTGAYASSGEIVVIRREQDGTLTVLGSL